MKFLFIVQGEGRGHLTQAITLEEILRKNGHEVVEILVGKSSARTLPGFFNRSVHAPVKRFISPNFLPSAQNKRASIGRSVVYNVMRFPVYVKSMLYIRDRIEKSRADIVINFYELLTGLAYAFLRPSVPHVCIGHQYLFLHRDFEFPDKSATSLFMLRFFTRLTSLGAVRRLALSFRQMDEDKENKISVIPPLLRAELATVEARKGDYIHGYMVNAGFAQNVLDYHARHPRAKLHFFWDKFGAEAETVISPHLSFHQIDDVQFIKYMAGCKAFASTAGFESICEAMYLGKPVLMVPAHIEQDCNAFDAMKAGAGIVSADFDLESLGKLAEYHQPDREFVYWAKSSERLLLRQLEEKIGQSSLSGFLTPSTNV